MKMKFLLLLFLCVLQILAEKEYENIALHRFCLRTCHKGVDSEDENLFCNCLNVTAPDNVKLNIIEDDLVEFRSYMLKTLNDFRQKIAKGQVENYPAADRMLILNYDVALEYAAHCSVRKLKAGGFKCIKTKEDTFPAGAKYSQMSESKNVKTMDGVKEEMEAFVKNAPSLKGTTYEKIKETYNDKDFRINTLIRTLYQLHERIGCVRASIPGYKDSTMREMIFCFFGYNKVEDNGYGTKRVLYKPGNPCSRCNFYELNCSTSEGYDALCGELKPVPTYKWKMGPLPNEPWLAWSEPGEATTGHSTRIEISLLPISVFFVALLVFN